MKRKLTIEEFKKLANYRAASFDMYEPFDDTYSNDHHLMNHYNEVLFNWIEKMDDDKINFIIEDHDRFLAERNKKYVVELNYRDYYNVFSEPIKEIPKLKKNQTINWIY